VSNVDRSKIGPGGYLVLLEDKGFQLPCTWPEAIKRSDNLLTISYSSLSVAGEIIPDGLTFRYVKDAEYPSQSLAYRVFPAS
jgi:hypothetical protein